MRAVLVASGFCVTACRCLADMDRKQPLQCEHFYWLGPESLWLAREQDCPVWRMPTTLCSWPDPARASSRRPGPFSHALLSHPHPEAPLLLFSRTFSHSPRPWRTLCIGLLPSALHLSLKFPHQLGCREKSTEAFHDKHRL